MAQKRKYFILHKPFKILSQFSDEDGNPGLGSLLDLPKDVYPVGRLDLDSEGLLILTNDKQLNHRLLNPKFKHRRTYWVEVDGVPNSAALNALQEGVTINVSGRQHATRPCQAQVIKPEGLQERIPPVNTLKHPIRSWLELQLSEGKNRQVRRMTAKVGHPTLRLLRVAIEDLQLGTMRSGDLTMISRNVIYKKLKLR
ncbi:MAG: pseudouridine synthase [Bacteroidota bacterium]